jgi:phage baseplate assembly protein W
MARTLGKVNVADLAENNYKVLGISINSASNTGGPFAVNYTTIEQAKSNLINLIMTRKGERLHQSEYGCDIWKILFENIVPDEIDIKVEQVITDAVSSWLPYITINQIILDYDDNDVDKNTFTIELSFYLSSNPSIGGQLTLNINNQ